MIYTGDALEVLKTMEDGSVDCCITSPPYNMRTRVRNGEYTTREKTEHFCKKYHGFGDDLTIGEFYGYHLSVMEELIRVCKIVLYNFQIVTGSKEAFFKIIGEMAKYIKDIISRSRIFRVEAVLAISIISPPSYPVYETNSPMGLLSLPRDINSI